VPRDQTQEKSHKIKWLLNQLKNNKGQISGNGIKNKNFLRLEIKS